MAGDCKAVVEGLAVSYQPPAYSDDRPFPGIMSDNATPDQTIMQDEKTMAVLAHVLQLVGGFIAPLVIFLVKRQSRFVSFHALQVLLLQGLYILLSGVMMIAWFGLMILTMTRHPHGSSSGPPEFFLVFPVIMLAWFVAWIVMLMIAIIFGIKAGRGEWAEYPILGKWARGILHLGPGGVPLEN